MPKYEYLIHEIWADERVDIDKLNGLGSQGYGLVMKNSYEYLQDAQADPQIWRMRKQFIFRREIPPEEFPS